ncbi:MAG: phage terminase large subunit [Clostridiales bacterium]|nr:phage terminase large subunit [Clostridiales bacterium]
MNLHLHGTPNPKQLAFFEAKARHIAYGGARGGGKSWAMRRKFVLLAFRYAGLNLLLLRRTLPELHENHVRPLQEELHGVVRFHGTQRVFLFPNGSRIKLGYCDKESDVYQYQGQEYDVVGLEEATHFTQAQMLFLTTCNRSVRVDFKPRMYYTCNPGGVGHAWVKRLFVDRDFRGDERPEDYVFIPARVTDNPVLMARNPEYLNTLKNLPEHLRKAHLDGNWDVLAGQYFTEFNRDAHVVHPFPIPTWWRRFRAMDWGYNDPCCVLWLAVSPEGRVIVYRELYARRTLSSEIARRVKEESRGEAIAYTVASPDAWQQRGLRGVEGQCIADVFAAGGVPLLPANNARISGWQRVREFLAAGADGQAGLQIFDTCPNLIRTLPLLTFDTFSAEDVADNCEDHAPEALRYGLMTRPGRSALPAAKRVARYDPLSNNGLEMRGYHAL